MHFGRTFNLKRKLSILNEIRKNPSITQKTLAKITGRSERTIKTKTVEMQEKGLIERVNGRRNGYWKMSECHIGYWELCPTIDHIYPIAMGGRDEPENWATTSMLNNSIKSNWTLEQMRWTLYEAGDFNEWDSLTNRFVSMVENTPELLHDDYIKNWYKSSLYILQRS